MAMWLNGEFSSWQVDDPIGVAGDVEFFVDRHPDGVVVCEEFELSTAMKGMTTGGIRATIELIGIVRYVAFRGGSHFVLQRPADARAFSTRDKLDKVGFRTPAKPDHRRSASRHLLLALVRLGAVDGASLLP
jgi:hypothetical protein